MVQTRKNIPKADSLMGSMRSIGYTFESAIADIIDNSISAHAKSIQLSFPTEASNCFVSIMDDGVGLTEDELFNAMRYGSNVGFCLLLAKKKGGLLLFNGTIIIS